MSLIKVNAMRITLGGMIESAFKEYCKCIESALSVH